MNASLVIFDLDGTLLDTVGDLAAACNAALAVRGLPQHSCADYRRFVGNGILRLVERALPEPLRTPEYVALVRADFVRCYLDRLDRHTRPYEGIPQLLDGLVARGVRLAVASNKFQAATERLVASFFPSVAFAAVLGQRPGVPLKPDPTVIEEVLARTGTPRAEALMVGDSGIDVHTASAAGVRSVGVAWGFRPRRELVEAGAGAVIDRPGQLLELLQRRGHQLQ